MDNFCIYTFCYKVQRTGRQTHRQTDNW